MVAAFETTRQQDGPCSVAMLAWGLKMTVLYMWLVSRQIRRNEHSTRSFKKSLLMSRPKGRQRQEVER